jgi:hypothetical protein
MYAPDARLIRRDITRKNALSEGSNREGVTLPSPEDGIVVFSTSGLEGREYGRRDPSR